MRDKTIDVLLQMGVPASIKGFTYICDAIELFDTDPYYPDGKICSLYFEIARLHETTASRVERAIRHAFEVALTKGERDIVELYLDCEHTQNSNLLKTLYFRMQRHPHLWPPHQIPGVHHRCGHHQERPQRPHGQKGHHQG